MPNIYDVVLLRKQLTILTIFPKKLSGINQPTFFWKIVAGITNAIKKNFTVKFRKKIRKTSFVGLIFSKYWFQFCSSYQENEL